MNTASAPATAAARSVVKLSRPAAILAATRAPSPGSKIGTSPSCSRAIFAASWSTQATVSPNSEKHAPETRPTYPVPIIAIRIRAPARSAKPNAAQNGGAASLFRRSKRSRRGTVQPGSTREAASTDVSIGLSYRRSRIYRQPRLQDLGSSGIPADRVRQFVTRTPRGGTLGAAGRGRSGGQGAAGDGVADPSRV